MKDVTKMKEMLEQYKRRNEELVGESEQVFDSLERDYLRSCGDSLHMPDKDRVFNSKLLAMSFGFDKELRIKMLGDCCNREVEIPKEFVDKFFKLVVNTKAQRDVVLKGIENLRNELTEEN